MAGRNTDDANRISQARQPLPRHKETDAPMTQDPATVELVQAAMLEAISRPVPKARQWQRSALGSDERPTCSFCHAPISDLDQAGKVPSAWLIPPSHGGPTVPGNVVACCRSCRTARRQLDAIAFHRTATLPPVDQARLLARRLENFSSSLNHLTPHSPHADRSRILAHLANRFANPRFRCFVATTSDACWIGWPPKDLIGRLAQEVAALLRYQAQGSPHPNPKLTLFAIAPDKFLDTIWELIERNALVEEVVIPTHEAPRPGDPDDWRQCWHRTFRSISQVHSRRSRIDPEVAPWPARELSAKPSAKSQRRAEAIKKMAGDRREYLAAKHALGAWLDGSADRQWSPEEALDTLAQMKRVLRLRLASAGRVDDDPRPL